MHTGKCSSRQRTSESNSDVLSTTIPKNKTHLKFIPESTIKKIPSLPFTDNDQISDEQYNISLNILSFNNIKTPNIKLPHNPNQNLHTLKNKTIKEYIFYETSYTTEHNNYKSDHNSYRHNTDFLPNISITNHNQHAYSPNDLRNKTVKIQLKIIPSYRQPYVKNHNRKLLPFPIPTSNNQRLIPNYQKLYTVQAILISPIELNHYKRLDIKFQIQFRSEPKKKHTNTSPH